MLVKQQEVKAYDLPNRNCNAFGGIQNTQVDD